jgi:hypothetical protein
MARRYERYREPVAPWPVFFGRLVRNTMYALILVLLTLAIGVWGYHDLESQSWLDAYASAAMLAAGMGPFREPVTEAGKFFAGTYALWCGLVVIIATGVILAPIVHRLLHRLHGADEG